NLIRERRGAGQKLVTEYRYDAQHRLVGVTLPGGGTASYKYDAFGRRIEKTVDGHTTEFLWQGERLIAESADNRYRSYIYEPGTFRPLAMLDGEGPRRTTPFYYQLDHLGTPQELTDYSGEIMWSAKYRAYGNLAALDVAEIDNPLRFQGQYFDAETGLHYNRHRYYNPGTGRFLTPDPIKLAGGLNNYQYVPNPTGWVDPLGLNNCPGGDGCKPDVNSGDSSTKPQVDEGEQKAPETGGAARAAQYAANWPKANLNNAVEKFAGPNPTITTTEKGKRIYKNPQNGVEVVEDMNGNYFRIYDPSLPGKRKYLNLDGIVPSNKTLPNGKQTGRTQSEYNEVTHFNKEP
ncbi:RHS repeat domain-containing protein, partial [Pseudomonas sp. R44(2017)]